MALSSSDFSSGGIELLDHLPVAAFVTDTVGRVMRYNAAAAALWGRTPVQAEARWSGAWRLIGAGGDLVPVDETPAARTFRDGHPPEPPLLLQVERPDGSRTAFVSRPTLLRDTDNQVVGVIELMLGSSDLAATTAADLTAARLAAIVASSEDAIIGKDLEGIVTSWNAGATRIFGWAPEEMIGQSITRLIPPELLSEERVILARLHRGESSPPFDTERLTRDGRRIAISVTVSPIRDGHGRVVGASKIARDITARKRGEALQRQLVEELNHRVKNTLATIQAIAAQSLRRAASPEAFVASFGGRVQALAHVHDRLVAGEMAGAALDALIRDALDAARATVLPSGLMPEVRPDRTAGESIVTEGPAVLVEPRIAVQLALVLHELARNAVQHGALADPRGRLVVSWRVEAGPEGRTLALDWREHQGRDIRAGGPQNGGIGAAFNGPTDLGPMGKDRRATGFGILLIERSLQANGGSALRQAGHDGLAWELRLPLPETPAGLPLGVDPPLVAPLPETAGLLAGRRVLVVEDEPFVALEIEMELEAVGAIVVGPAANLAAAARLIEGEPIDAALLDANLAGQPVDTLAAALDARGVPFAFASGYGPSGLPEGFRDRPLLGKPFGGEAVIQMVETLVIRAEAQGGATIIPMRKRD